MSLELLNDNIKLEKKRRNVIEKLPQTVVYSPSLYGINTNYTGKGVKIAVLDSGFPRHKDIKTTAEKISFCNSNVSEDDNNGHSTIISGIINANNKKSIVGLAPHASLLFGKVVDSSGICSFNSLVAGVLWAIVKEVDIILIALGTQYDYLILHDAIKKANKHGICIFAAAGDAKDGDIDFPARYRGVFSCGFMSRSKDRNAIIKKQSDATIPNKGMVTTYLDNKYVKMSGSSISAAFFTGISAVLIEQYKKEKKRNISSLVYSNLVDIFR